jgi:hypothetical protein
MALERTKKKYFGSLPSHSIEVHSLQSNALNAHRNSVSGRPRLRPGMDLAQETSKAKKIL